MILKPGRNIEGMEAQQVDVTGYRLALSKWKYVALTFGFCFMVAVIVIIILVVCGSSSPTLGALIVSTSPDTTTIPTVTDSEETDRPLGRVTIVSRNEWGAQPPTEPLIELQHPVPYVIISHTATDFCKTQSECSFRVRFAQTFHIESLGWSDIGYNFLVGGDGYAYMGRGWDYVGAHTYNYNTKSIGISFIGTFNDVVPPKRQLHAAQQLIKLGVKTGMIAPDYKLLGHCQLSSTGSPGDALYKVLKTWPHWSPEP